MPRPTRPHQPEPTAAEVYAKRRADIDRLLKDLRANLAVHAKAYRDDSANWGFAGDLGKVREDLINTVAFLAEMEPEDVEATLR